MSAVRVCPVAVGGAVPVVRNLEQLGRDEARAGEERSQRTGTSWEDV